MRVTVTVQPAPLVTLDEAKVALGESGTDRDGLITGLILAAQAELDGPKSWVGISVAQQTVEVSAATFDDPVIRLPGGPIIGDVEVTYLDGNGLGGTLDVNDYVLLADGTLSLPSGASWPTLYDQENAVTVTYDVGIEDGDDPRISLMKTAIIMHVKMHLDMADPATYRRTIESLVAPLRVLSV